MVWALVAALMMGSPDCSHCNPRTVSLPLPRCSALVVRVCAGGTSAPSTAVWSKISLTETNA